MKFDSFLFDLDGTLVDSAPDLAFALNQTLLKNNHLEKDFLEIRKLVSKGGKALIKFGFDIDENDKNFKKYHAQLLRIYTKNIAKYSKLFIDRDFLNAVEWGIVTNKPTDLTNLLLKALNLEPKVVVCGDSLSENKPSAAPVLLAMEQLQNKNTIFIGDDITDIRAGKNAKIATIAVSYGYGIPDKNWGYDFLITNPKDIYQFKL